MHKLNERTGEAKREPVSAGDYEGSNEVDSRQLKVESKQEMRALQAAVQPVGGSDGGQNV